NESCHKKTSTQAPIIDHVMVGVPMRGLSSEIGNKSPHRDLMFEMLLKSAATYLVSGLRL
ncbi:MAG: hypothetical protein OEU55_13470, partial [Desulfobacterales bacterium]|nr:hypothetical protein [Desulfobacterales bacterium]